MKKTIISLIAVIITTTTCAMDHDIDAQQWCRKVTMGWNLGNALESAGAGWNYEKYAWENIWQQNYNEWETAWGNPKTTQEMLKKVKAEGFNAVRIPVRWVPHADINTMTIDPVWLARVKEVVDWALAEDLMVIINTHHECWLEYYPLYSRKTELTEKLKTLWTNIANAFASYDGRLAFAGTNEVNAKGDWGLTPTDENYAVQNAFNQAFVDAVRATGGNNLHRNLIVQTYRCNPTMGLSHLTVPNDPTERRLSVEFHYYDPYSYCSGTENSYFYWGNAYADKGAITPDGNERSLTSLFLQVRKAWWDKGLGVIIGEYGCSHHYTTADRATQEANQGYYLECLVKEARRHGFAAFVWDNNAFGNGNEKFGIFERNNKMSVGCPFFVEGIRKGSLQEYEATVDYDESDPDVGIGGKVLWEGEKNLNWGEGLQLKISASEFKAFTGSCTLVAYYRQDANASYENLQLNYGDWTQFRCTVEGTPCNGNFSPRSYYGTTGATHITPFTVSGSVLTKLKKSGAVIQGFGVIMTKVVIIDKPNTAISTITNSPTPSRIYNLRGVEVKKPRRGEVYIVGGKKILY